MPSRKELPARRGNTTHAIMWLDKEHSVTFGHFEDGPLAEVFISLRKAGSGLDGVARDGAVLMSLCLQYGVPFETIAKAITRDGDGKPSTIIGAVVDIILKEQSK
jgi:hypothetical protein